MRKDVAKAVLSVTILCAWVLIFIASSKKISSVSATQCYPLDASYVTDRLECGTIAWELVAQDTANDVWDEGNYNQSGMCGGSYTDCNCNYVQPYTLNASNNFHDVYDSLSGTWTWWWDLYGYNPPTYSTCTSGPCAGTGQIETKNPTTFYDQGYDSNEYLSCDY